MPTGRRAGRTRFRSGLHSGKDSGFPLVCPPSSSAGKNSCVKGISDPNEEKLFTLEVSVAMHRYDAFTYCMQDLKIWMQIKWNQFPLAINTNEKQISISYCLSGRAFSKKESAVNIVLGRRAEFSLGGKVSRASEPHIGKVFPFPRLCAAAVGDNATRPSQKILRRSPVGADLSEVWSFYKNHLNIFLQVLLVQTKWLHRKPSSLTVTLIIQIRE